MNNMDKGWPLHEVKPGIEEKNTNEEDVAATAVMEEEGFSLGKEPTFEELLEKTNGKLGPSPERGVDWEINDEVFVYLAIEGGVPSIVIEDLKTGKISNNKIENYSDIDEMLATLDTKIIPKAMIAKANENKPEEMAV